MLWLSYECFSILCDAFLLKSVIFSHKCCASTMFTKHYNWNNNKFDFDKV